MARSNPFRGEEIFQGTPDDVFPNHREWIQHIKSSNLLKRPFRTLTPKERVIQRERLHQYRRQCLKYRKYRDPGGTAKTSGNLAREPKWPHHFEAVFWEGEFGRALLEHPPRQREKEQLRSGEKQWGRNELIANYMLKHLPKGEMDAALIGSKSAPRKFVSSHLQVLRGKFASIVYSRGHQDFTDLYYFGEVLLWLGPTESGKNGRKPKRPGPDWDHLMEHFFPGFLRLVEHSKKQSIPHTELQPCVELAPPKFEPEFFSMRLERGSDGGGRPSTTVITQSTQCAQQLSDIYLDTADWQYQYPQLFAQYQQGRLPANIVLGEVSLTIPERRNLQNDTRLIIEDIFTAPRSLTGECHARTRIYVDNDHVFTPNFHVEKYENQGCLYHQPQFGADPFWQRQIAGSMVTDQVRSRIRRIVTVQELFDTKPRDETQVPDLLVYWTFCVAPPERPGSTRFRKVIPPNDMILTNRPYMELNRAIQKDDVPYDNSATTTGVYGHQRHDSMEIEAGTSVTQGGELPRNSQGSHYALSQIGPDGSTALPTIVGWRETHDDSSIGRLGYSTPSVSSLPLGTSTLEGLPSIAGFTEDASMQVYDPEILQDAGSMPSTQGQLLSLQGSSYAAWPNTDLFEGSEYLATEATSEEPRQHYQAQGNGSFGAYANFFEKNGVDTPFEIPRAAWHQQSHVESLRSTQNGQFMTQCLESQANDRPYGSVSNKSLTVENESPSHASIDNSGPPNVSYEQGVDQLSPHNSQCQTSQTMYPDVHDFVLQQPQRSRSQVEHTQQHHLYPAPTLPSMPSTCPETTPVHPHVSSPQLQHFTETQQEHFNPSPKQNWTSQQYHYEAMDERSGHQQPVLEANSAVERYRNDDNSLGAANESREEPTHEHEQFSHQLQTQQQPPLGSQSSAAATHRHGIPYPSRILDYQPHHRPEAYHDLQAINHATQNSSTGQQEASPLSNSTPSTLPHPRISQQRPEVDFPSSHDELCAQEHSSTHSSVAAAVQNLEAFDSTTCWEAIAATASGTPPAPQPGGEEEAELVAANAHTEFFEQHQIAEWERQDPQSSQIAAEDDVIDTKGEGVGQGGSNSWAMTDSEILSGVQPPQTAAQVGTPHDPRNDSDLPESSQDPADHAVDIACETQANEHLLRRRLEFENQDADAGAEGWVYVRSGATGGSAVSSFDSVGRPTQQMEYQQSAAQGRIMQPGADGEETEWVDAWTAGGQQQQQEDQ